MAALLSAAPFARSVASSFAASFSRSASSFASRISASAAFALAAASISLARAIASRSIFFALCSARLSLSAADFAAVACRGGGERRQLKLKGAEGVY